MEDIIIKNEILTKDFLELRKIIGWSEISPQQIEKALENSMLNISVYINNKCIGIGRIVGDNILKGMLTDIMVLPEYHKKGIGKIIVTSLIERLSNNIKEGECFQLEASPTAKNRDFYIKCGLKYKPENQDGVYLWIRK